MDQNFKTFARFLATMSHEIRTPMNTIIGNTELALAGSLPREQRDNLEMVKESAKSLLDLLDHIVDFSWIGSGRLELRQDGFDLREFLDNTVGSLMAQAERKGVALYCRIDPSLPGTVIADSTRLRTALTSLLGDALKSAEKGEVLLQVEKAGKAPTTASQLHGRADDMESVMIHVSIIRSSIGIAHWEKVAVFDDFTQGVGLTTGDPYGIGIALSTQLIQLMGGHVWFESEEGKEGIFHFTAKLGCHVGKNGMRPAGNVFNSIPVLLVGGSNTGRSILREILESWGFPIKEAEDGKGALAMMYASHAMGKPFRLLVLDSSVAEADTMEFIRRVKLSPTLALSEVIFLFSPRDERDTSFTELSQICTLVRKPAVELRLLDAVRAALGQEAPVPDAMNNQEEHYLGRNSFQTIFQRSRRSM